MIVRILRSAMVLAAAVGIALAALLHYLAGWPWLIALPVGLLTPTTCHALLLGVEFALTVWLGRAARLPEQVARYELGGIFKAWLTEIPVAIRVFCWNMPLFGHHRLTGAADGDKIPVVLVHGYFCNQALFKPLAGHLSRLGHPIETMNLEPVFGSIDSYPALIRQAVEKARQRSKTGEVALVGHSMGGIAIRAYLRDYGVEGIGPIITLGSPHKGTQLAYLGHTRIVRQLRPGNRWLKALENTESPALTRRFTVVLSEHDNIVTPQRSQWLPGSRVIAFTGLGHVDLACHRAVWSVIDDSLERHNEPRAFDPGAFAPAS
ncbi:MAG: esterase/lipase family protein [Burkholderiaceae bacterium]